MRGLMAVLSRTTWSVNANSKNNISTNEKDAHGQGESGKYNVGEPISIRKLSYLDCLNNSSSFRGANWLPSYVHESSWK